MKLNKASSRFWLGFACLMFVLIAGFGWVGYEIPTWNATEDEVSMALPGDELVPQPQIEWTHGLTIQTPVDEIYPWLIQMGDTRGAYYSYTFIENLFMMAGKMEGRYRNATQINTAWQNPPLGQGMIVDMFSLQDYNPQQYVLAGATDNLTEMGVHWSWLWYLQPVDSQKTRLIVRHRFMFPEEAPVPVIKAVLNTGYVMERGMMLGIRSRAEGRNLLVPVEPVEILLWLAAFVCGVISAVRFVRKAGRFHPLGIGLEAVIVLFIFTFVQPALWVRTILVIMLAGSVWIDFHPGKMTRLAKGVMGRRV